MSTATQTRPAAAVTAVLPTVTFAMMTYFKWTKYVEQGFSYGFARTSDLPQDLFVGSSFMVFPSIGIIGDVVLGHTRDTGTLTEHMVRKGVWIAICIEPVEKGYGGRWCLKSVWDAAVKKAEEVKKRVQVNPSNLANALQSGWNIHTENGNQVVVHLKREGEKTLTRTFCRKVPAAGFVTPRRRTTTRVY